MAVDVRMKEDVVLDGKIEYRAAECQRCGFDTNLEAATFCVVSDNMTHRWGGEREKVIIKNSEDAQAFVFCDDCSEVIFNDQVARGNYQRDVRRFLEDNNMVATIIAFFVCGLLLGVLAMRFL